MIPFRHLTWQSHAHTLACSLFHRSVVRWISKGVVWRIDSIDILGTSLTIALIMALNHSHASLNAPLTFTLTQALNSKCLLNRPLLARTHAHPHQLVQMTLRSGTGQQKGNWAVSLKYLWHQYYPGQLYRARLKGLGQVWGILSLLLLTTPA